MFSIITIAVLIVAAILIAGWIKKKKEVDVNKSDGTIHPKETIHHSRETVHHHQE